MSEALNSVFRYKQPDRHSIFPTIFVGLGGAGGQMVERVVEKIKLRWDADKYDGLYHAFVLDTDINALNGYRSVPEGNRVLLSDFDKRWYTDGKRGESYVDADPFMTNWVHPWYQFRTAHGDGAGQIRLESRLALHHQLEQDRGKIIETFQRGIHAALHHDNPYRCSSPTRFNVHIYSSVAGGTGSGIFLSMAYLWQRLLRDVNHDARVYGYLMLPGPFFGTVPHVQEREIDANGYAALKELEHLMTLGVQGTHGQDAETFHFSGYHRNNPQVTTAPFNFVYLLDDPARLATTNLSEYRDTIADAMFVQFFSPVFGAQQSGWDNMIKLVSSGTSQGYVLNYGTYGANVLILPAKDILGYCAHRYALDAIDRFLLQRGGGAEEGAFGVPTDTPEWQRLSDAKRAEKLDGAFATMVDQLAAREAQAALEGGVWTGIKEMRSSSTEGALRDAFRAEVDRLAERLKANISVERAGTRTIATHDHDVHARRAALEADLTRSHNAIGAAWATMRADVEGGILLRRFFEEHGVNPLGQRYFLIQLARGLKARLSELDGEITERRRNLDLGSESRVSEFDAQQRALTETAPTTLWERIRKENADFNAARAKFVDWFNRGLVQGWTDTLRLECEQRVIHALVKRIDALLQTFRDLVGQAEELRRRLANECDHILRHGALDATTAEANQFAFDIEVLRDEASGRRLWDRYYTEAFSGNHAYFSPADVLPMLNAAFAPERDSFGTLRQPDVGVIAQRIAGNLRGLGERRLRPLILGEEELTANRARLGLLIDDALNLEARYVLELPQSELAARDRDEIAKYIRQKLAHARRKAEVLCTIHPPAPDGAIQEDHVVIACGHPVYQGSLGDRLEKDLGCEFNTNWDDPRTVLLYTARLGMPLFYVRSINERMKHAYRQVQAEKVARRAYPLHVEYAWENTLADLDPVERRKEREQASLDEGHIRFGFCRIAGVVDRPDGTWRLQVGTYERALGATLPAALEEFKALREDVARRLDGEIAAVRAELESPDEPASSWEPVATYVREVSDACLTLPPTNLLHEHRAVMSSYLRKYAPSDVLTSLEAVLAPLPA